MKTITVEDLKTMKDRDLVWAVKGYNKNEERITAENQVLSESGSGKNHIVVAIINDIAIIHNWVNPIFKEAQYTFSVRHPETNVWSIRGSYSQSEETAYLEALGNKHLGNNNQFANFATKMLSIDIK